MKISVWRSHAIYRQLIFPILLYVLIYFFSPYFPHFKVNIDAPYLFEKALFSIQWMDNPITINEWWQHHSSLTLDVLASLSYIAFFMIFIFIAVYLYFTTSDQHKDKPFFIGWSLVWLGIAYFITAHLYPVAPPWYVTQYGLSNPITYLYAHANAIGCNHFDAFIHYQLCGNYIGNGPYPFGAMPSMHVGIPLLCVYYAFKYHQLKLLCVMFYLVEIFATLYLNQHYLIDLIAGSLYAFAIAACLDKYHTWRSYAASNNQSQRYFDSYNGTVYEKK